MSFLVPAVSLLRRKPCAARTLEWVSISFSNAWKWKVKVKSLSRVHLSSPVLDYTICMTSTEQDTEGMPTPRIRAPDLWLGWQAAGKCHLLRVASGISMRGHPAISYVPFFILKGTIFSQKNPGAFTAPYICGTATALTFHHLFSLIPVNSILTGGRVERGWN